MYLLCRLISSPRREYTFLSYFSSGLIISLHLYSTPFYSSWLAGEPYPEETASRFTFNTLL